jgi:hypothetical protein
MLVIVPLALDEANAAVERWHRHHRPVVGHKFSLGCESPTGLCGAAIVGRPVARMVDDGWTLEVCRVATDGTKNASSMLYGAARRATFALGYRRLITYTLPSESGSSLRAAGYRMIGAAGGGSWSRPSRPRIDKAPLQEKIQWDASRTAERGGAA